MEHYIPCRRISERKKNSKKKLGKILSRDKKGEKVKVNERKKQC